MRAAWRPALGHPRPRPTRRGISRMDAGERTRTGAPPWRGDRSPAWPVGLPPHPTGARTPARRSPSPPRRAGAPRVCGHGARVRVAGTFPPPPRRRAPPRPPRPTRMPRSADAAAERTPPRSGRRRDARRVGPPPRPAGRSRLRCWQARQGPPSPPPPPPHGHGTRRAAGDTGGGVGIGRPQTSAVRRVPRTARSPRTLSRPLRPRVAAAAGPRAVRPAGASPSRRARRGSPRGRRRRERPCSLPLPMYAVQMLEHFLLFLLRRSTAGCPRQCHEA